MEGAVTSWISWKCGQRYYNKLAYICSIELPEKYTVKMLEKIIIDV